MLPAYRKLGLARLLLNYMDTESLQNKIEKVVCSIPIQSKDIQDVLMKMGYKMTSDSSNFYSQVLSISPSIEAKEYTKMIL